jgi:heterodisulfide reductase subunit A
VHGLHHLCRILPGRIPGPIQSGHIQNKATHVYFSQAIPLVAYIDESCLYLKEKKCRICEGVCQNDAIDFIRRQKSWTSMGAIILSSGNRALLILKSSRSIGYREFENVVTSMDYERLLSSTGPYEGKVRRASDKKHPQEDRLDSMRRFQTGHPG